MILFCRSMFYEPGDRYYEQGFRAGVQPHMRGKSFVEPNSWGGAIVSQPSRYFLLGTGSVTQERVQVDVGFFFKTNGIRLTKKRRQRIEATMPQTLTIRRETSGHNSWWQPDENEMLHWAVRADLM